MITQDETISFRSIEKQTLKKKNSITQRIELMIDRSKGDCSTNRAMRTADIYISRECVIRKYDTMKNVYVLYMIYTLVLM